MPDVDLMIHWSNLSQSTDAVVTATLHSFAEQLTANYAEFAKPSFLSLGLHDTDRLRSYLLSQLPGSAPDDTFGEYQDKRIFVFCTENDPLVRTYQESNPLAHWGVAIPCTLAMAWYPAAHLVWHELLHLMNAQDCYNKFGINKCPEPRCIMRRAPSLETCGDRLTLCSKNIHRLRRFTKRLTDQP